MAADVKGVCSPCCNVSSLYTKYSKCLHLLVSTAKNSPWSLLSDLCMVTMIGLINAALYMERSHNIFCIRSNSDYKFLHSQHLLFTLVSFWMMHVFYLFHLAWTGKEDSLRSKQLSRLWHTDIHTASTQLQLWQPPEHAKRLCPTETSVTHWPKAATAQPQEESCTSLGENHFQLQKDGPELKIWIIKVN